MFHRNMQSVPPVGKQQSAPTTVWVDERRAEGLTAIAQHFVGVAERFEESKVPVPLHEVRGNVLELAARGEIDPTSLVESLGVALTLMCYREPDAVKRVLNARQIERACEPLQAQPILVPLWPRRNECFGEPDLRADAAMGDRVEQSDLREWGLETAAGVDELLRHITRNPQMLCSDEESGTYEPIALWDLATECDCLENPPGWVQPDDDEIEDEAALWARWSAAVTALTLAFNWMDDAIAPGTAEACLTHLGSVAVPTMAAGFAKMDHEAA